MAITDKPRCPARPRFPKHRGRAASGAASPAARHRPGQGPRRAGGDGWNGPGRGRGRGRRGEMSRSLRETRENRKPAGRGGAALASPSPLAGSPRRAAAAAAPWAVSSLAAGSRPRAASSRSSKREPGRTRRPESRRLRSTAGTCEPRYRAGAGARGHRLSRWAAPRPLLPPGVCGGAVLRQGARLTRSRFYGSLHAVQCVYLNN